MSLEHDQSKGNTETISGDKVIFGGWGDPVTVNEKQYYFIRKDDIIAVLK